MEIEIGMLVLNGSAKLAVSFDLQKNINIGSGGDVFRRVFDLKLSEVQLTEIFQFLMDNMSSKYPYVKLNFDANYFLQTESKDCINHASYKYKKTSAKRGTLFELSISAY